jgi:3-oxoacyl-[acyl-carrier-protein] synthase II
MNRRVVVTGLGSVTSLGLKVEDLWRRVLAGESGIGPITLFDTAGGDMTGRPFKVNFAGEVRGWSPTGYITPKDEKRIDRFAQFALVAGIDAVKDSGIDFAREDAFRCGVIIGSGVGGITEMEEQLIRLVAKGPDRVSAFCIPKLMVNAGSGHVSIQYGLRGMNTAVATACASAANAIGDAMAAIRHNVADVMITGGSEAAITRMGIAGFSNMRALSERNDAPQKASRPFDADRDGFVLSEGAGILVLEELEHAKKRGARIYAELRQRRRRPHHAARRRGDRRGQGDGAGPARCAA